MSVTAIILAAGRASRFEDGQKLVAELDRVPLVRRVALAAADSSAAEILVIVERLGNAVECAAGSGRWRFIENAQASSGLASSLRVGVGNVAPSSSGVAVLLADMPLLPTALIDRTITIFEQTGGNRIAFPIAPDGMRGHPVIWPRSLFGALAGLTGDGGARGLIQAHPDICQPVPTDDWRAFSDVDTRADLERLRGPRS